MFLLSIVIFYGSIESFPILYKNRLNSRIILIAFLKFNSKEKLILNLEFMKFMEFIEFIEFI